MNNLPDEILNKYIDNELDQAALKMVRDQLKNSEADRKRLKALQAADNAFRNINKDSVSPDFTSAIMMRIAKKSKSSKEQRTFIVSISSVFVILALAALGYILSLMFSSAPAVDGSVSVTGEVFTFLKNIIGPVRSFFGSVNVSVIGSVFSLGLLISVYFVIDMVKHTRQNLGRQH